MGPVDLAAKRAWVPSNHQKAARPFGFPLSDALICILRELRKLNPNGSHVFRSTQRSLGKSARFAE